MSLASDRGPNSFALHWPGKASGTRCSSKLTANCACELVNLTCLRCAKSLYREAPTQELAQRITEIIAEKAV